VDFNLLATPAFPTSDHHFHCGRKTADIGEANIRFIVSRGYYLEINVLVM